MSPAGGPRFGKSMHKRFLQRQQETAAAVKHLQRREAVAERARRHAEEGSAAGSAIGQGGAATPGGGGWNHGSPSPTDSRLLPAADTRRGRGVVEGQARDARVDKFPHWFVGGRQVPTATFRVESFDDRANQVWLVPVEAQGERVDGFVRDGDAVQVAGRFKRGTLRATEIVNFTNGSMLRLAGSRHLVQTITTILGVLVVLAIGAAIVAGAFFDWRPPGIGGDSCPPPDFPSQPPGCP